MAEILHQLVDSLYHYLQCFIHPRWCRISSINSMASLQVWKRLFQGVIFFDVLMLLLLSLASAWDFRKKDGKSMGICLEKHMGVSKNRVFTCFYPKSSILTWVFHYKPSILGEKNVFFLETPISNKLYLP